MANQFVYLVLASGFHLVISRNLTLNDDVMPSFISVYFNAAILFYRFQRQEDVDALHEGFALAKTFLETYTCIRFVEDSSKRYDFVTFTNGIYMPLYEVYDFVQDGLTKREYGITAAINLSQYGNTFSGVLRVLLRVIGLYDLITYESASDYMHILYDNMQYHCLELFELRSTEDIAGDFYLETVLYDEYKECRQNPDFPLILPSVTRKDAAMDNELSENISQYDFLDTARAVNRKYEMYYCT